MPATPTPAPDFDALAVGDVVAEREVHLTRDSLVRYAGASSDFNPIHYRDDVAAWWACPACSRTACSRWASRSSRWSTGPATRREWPDYQVRFTRPVVVDPESGADVSVSAKVGQLDAEARAARIDLTVTRRRDRARQGAGPRGARLT